jgi:branched-chain amino acid transport system ATP-binding protein
MPGHDIVSLGICHSPEGRRIFPRMTVKENLELGAFLRNNKSEVAADMERVLDLFPRLKERIKQTAGTMSGGEQQMLAVSRALMGDPKLLLLDEPSMGLAPVLVELIFDTIVKIRKQGITILLIEQNATAALEVADRAYVLESGKVKMSGSAKELSSDDKVTKAYLGH